MSETTTNKRYSYQSTAQLKSRNILHAGLGLCPVVYVKGQGVGLSGSVRCRPHGSPDTMARHPRPYQVRVARAAHCIDLLRVSNRDRRDGPHHIRPGDGGSSISPISAALA